MTIAAAHGDVDTVGRAEHRLGEVHRTLGRFDLALESFGQSLSHRPDASSVYADRALLYVRTGDLIAAREDARKSLELARASGEKTELSRSLTVLALVSEDQATALSLLDEALELAGDDAVSRMSVLNNKALFLAQRAEIDQAIGLIEEAIDLAQRTGHRHREAALHNHLADLHHQAGREDQAAGSLSAAVSLFADIDAGAWEPEIWLLRQW